MSAPRTVVAYVPDLMDRSRLGALDAEFVASPADLVARGGGADVVVVDLSRPGALDAAVDLAAAGVDVVGFAPHVDDELRAGAAAAGVRVLPRSRFFGSGGTAQVLGSPNVPPPSV